MTDREKIIRFLEAHPDWVDAYRKTCAGGYTSLTWLTTNQPLAIGVTFHGTSPLPRDDRFLLPPSGEWRPKLEKEVFEARMFEGTFGYAYGSNGQHGRANRLVYANPSFVGHRVRVTIEAID